MSRMMNGALLGVLLGMCVNANACTGLQLKAKDGTFVNGRTIEFGEKIAMNALVIPRNYSFTGTLPDNNRGKKYQSRYAAVGVGPVDESIIADGLNEAGLSVATFYLPDYAVYPPITDQNRAQALSPFEFANWLLTQFASIDEVKQNLNTVFIAATPFQAWGFAPPLHYIVYDKTGKSLVIEPLKGQLVAYDNPLEVITNAPTFDWHITNLSNYVNLSTLNVSPRTIDDLKLQQFGEGSGLHGLPGDFTPPSRFVRAAIFSSSILPALDNQANVFQAFHVLNQFDIPLGSVRSNDTNTGKQHLDYTMLTSVKDPQNLRYYFKTYEDQNIKVISLKSFNLTAKQIKKILNNGTQVVSDVSRTLG